MLPPRAPVSVSPSTVSLRSVNLFDALGEGSPGREPAEVGAVAERWRRAPPVPAPGTGQGLAATDGEASFGALARARTTHALDVALAEARALHPLVEPSDPALKRFRKQVLDLRNQVDLFAPAYASKESAAAWRELRRSLDAGYEHLGALKDLFDGRPPGAPKGDQHGELQYPKKELARRRRAALAWRDDFFAPAKVAQTRALLEGASSSLGEVKRRHQSSFFWGGVAATPSASLSGLENVARLARAQIAEALRELDEVTKHERLRGAERREAFHDLRKRLRAVANLLDAYPELLRAPAAAAGPRAVLVAAIDACGVLQDRLLALQDARGAERRALERKIDARWAALRERQAREELRGALAELARSIASAAERP